MDSSSGETGQEKDSKENLKEYWKNKGIGAGASKENGNKARGGVVSEASACSPGIPYGWEFMS